MGRLIDADTIFNGELLVINTAAYDAVRAIIEKINNAPTVEAEPVVRCKDCRFHEHEELGMVWCPNVVGSWMAEYGFCSMGERRKDETD